MVQGHPILFTADTGASKTIISKRIFDEIEPAERPVLSKSSRLVGPSGAIINEIGKAVFILKMGKVSVEVEAVVAEIDDEGLLGIDVLQNSDGGPADLLLSKGVFVVQGQDVPIIQVGLRNRLRRVIAADHSVIPAQTESVIDVYVERYEQDDFVSENKCLIEPTEHFKETYPLQMAATLVDINNGCTCKIRLLNPFPTAISIKQDAVIGNAEAIIGSPTILFEQESQVQERNFCKIRRMEIKGTKEAESFVERNIVIHTDIKESPDLNIPGHLKDLYERSTEYVKED